LGAVALTALSIGSTAMAQDFNIQMFRPSAHPYDLWATRTTSIAPHLTFGGGTLLHYAKDPLVFIRELPNGNEQRHTVVGHQFGFDAWGNVAFWDHLSVGLAVPVVLVNSGDTGFISIPGAASGISGAAMGDIRLDVKGTFLRNEENGFGIGANLVMSFPTNAGTPYAGDDGFTFTPQLLLDFNKKGYFAAVNAGVRIRTQSESLEWLDVENELLLGLGVGIPLVDQLLLGAELQTTSNLSDPFADENQTQIGARGGLRYNFDFGLGVEAGAGGGFIRGYGNPSISAFAGVRFDPPRGPKDADGDGIYDDVDQCPLDPEDFDNFEDRDGCPDPDNDKDGILDVEDQCPNDPEDFDGFQDVDGCPDPDNDQDGIPDVEDQCPNDPEDFDGFEDANGCPDPDNDQDGILDVKDQCPNDPETKNNFQDEDGCPDEARRARIEGKKIVILDKVFFVYDKAIILEQSYPVLMEVAQILKENAPIKKVLIEGHTDSRGSDSYNRSLSDRRAKAVREFLIKQGIDRNRMLAKGFGEERPIASNDDDEGRQKNRRVEFTIIEVEGELNVQQ
jgi:outer membrane protein OmpA-like peptidoglycan-associated protein